MFILAKISYKTNSPTFFTYLRWYFAFTYFYIVNSPTFCKCTYFFSNLLPKHGVLWQSEGFNPKPIELNLVLFILAKISCKNKCTLKCTLFCTPQGTYFVVPYPQGVHILLFFLKTLLTLLQAASDSLLQAASDSLLQAASDSLFAHPHPQPLTCNFSPPPPKDN